MKPITIIGAGLAGYSVAREFRKLDKTTPLLIIAADQGNFYSKPMLSNAFAKGTRAEQLIMQTATQMAEELAATVTTGVQAHYIDSTRKTIDTSAGTFTYDKLVLAVGARPIRVVMNGDAADQLQSINHIDDYIGFRTRIGSISEGKPARIAILGAGLIGCEFANDLADAGHSVTLIDPNLLPLASLAPSVLSNGLQSALIARGVNFRLGTTAICVNQTKTGLSVTLADGASFETDLVLSAVGLHADLALAHTAKLATGRGILVNAIGQTSTQDIYALGDCAEYTVNANGDTILMPYVTPLIAAARAVAHTLTGQCTAIDLKPTPVIVKTPCYPLTLLPPPAREANNGRWVTQSGTAHTICSFHNARGVMTGFGIASHDVSLRKELLEAIGTMEPME